MVQLTSALVKDCTHYSDDAFKLCRKVFADKCQGDFTKESFEEAKLEVKKGPLYRFFLLFLCFLKTIWFMFSNDQNAKYIKGYLLASYVE